MCQIKGGILAVIDLFFMDNLPVFIQNEMTLLKNSERYLDD
ncbi:hypothetical protein AO372_1204 [Moraxella catarrhalis]|nr:hypothetical protein AO372_1204 [Moraxella catarrhalis]